MSMTQSQFALLVIFGIIISTFGTIINNYDDWSKPSKWWATGLNTIALILFNFSVFYTMQQGSSTAVISEMIKDN